MTPSVWAGADPVDDSPEPPEPAAPGGPGTTPRAAAKKPGSWADLDGAVRSIGEHALKANLARARNLDEAVRLATAGPLEDDRRTAAVEAAHQLVGSAGTFGYSGASARAAALEQLFASAVFDEPELVAARAQVSALFAELAADPDY